MPVQTAFNSPVNYSSGIDHSYELQENYVSDGLPPFQFRRRTGDINWRKLSSIDVDRVARELDFLSLQENISTVTFCNIDAISDVDPLVAKLFKLAQYTIEYLLHSQDYLQSVVSDYEVKLEGSMKEIDSLQKKIIDMEEEVVKVKQENKKRRKMIQQQQMLIEAGASSYYQCPHCEKAFMNASFLQGHMQRRHPGSVNYIGDVIAHSQKAQTRLGDQLKNLEGELKTEREDFNRKLKRAEEEKQRWEDQSRMEMDQWKAEEEARWKKELSVMRESFISDIDKLKVKEEVYQKTITELQQTMDVRHSNLGDLVDDFQEEKHKLHEYEERVTTLEQMNNAKNRKIEDLTATMKVLRKETSNLQQSGQLLAEQERKMQQLKKEVKRNASGAKLNKLQKQLNRLSRSDTQPKQLFLSEDETDTTNEIELDGRRLEEIQAMLPQIKQHLLTLLDEKLKNSGVDPAAAGITSAALTRKLLVLKTERQQTAKQIAGYYQSRENLRRKMEDLARKRFSPAAAPSKSTSKQAKKSASAKKQPHATPKKRETKLSPSRAKRRMSPRGQRSSQKASIRRENADPDENKESFLPSASSPMTQDTRRGKSSTKQSPMPSPRNKDGSPWDSEESSLLSAISNGSDVDDILDDDVQDASPRRVKELGKTIEKKLLNRKKPPAGAVDVTPRKETVVEEFHLSDDDDSFGVVSSLDDEVVAGNKAGNSRAPPTAGVRRSVASNSSNTYGTSVWGSGQKDTKEKQEISDWDDDLDIDELMT